MKVAAVFRDGEVSHDHAAPIRRVGALGRKRLVDGGRVHAIERVRGADEGDVQRRRVVVDPLIGPAQARVGLGVQRLPANVAVVRQDQHHGDGGHGRDDAQSEQSGELAGFLAGHRGLRS